MAIDAKNFVDNASAWLPGLEMAAKLTGRKLLTSAVAILRRAVDNPESKEKLIEWMRWLPIFEGPNAGEPEPSLPAEYADLQAEAQEFRAGCQDCDQDDCGA